MKKLESVLLISKSRCLIFFYLPCVLNLKKEQVKVKDLLDLNAETFFADDVVVEEERLVVVENSGYDLITCYEWIVRKVDDGVQTYKILVDATNSRVIEIDVLQ